MKKCSTVLFVCVVVLFSVAARGQVVDLSPEGGVSLELAAYRKSVLSNISYTISFDIPRLKSQPIQAVELIEFTANSNQRALQLDFLEDRSKLKSLKINGEAAEIIHQQEHIIIDKKRLKIGNNTLEIVFEAGESALNRNADFLYTLFVPDRARTVFPCFDQPDLKATYQLTLEIPADWKAIANANIEHQEQINDRTVYRFGTSESLSTYLFAFAAGKFERIEGSVNHSAAEFLYRESDTAKINHSMKEIFDIHSNSLKFFEQWTGIPYPFKKFGFVAIPDFQFGGMEHPGNIQYKASSLFLDGGATKDQINSRSNLIAHETAHMWFGDLVTMKWFNDVWMKEVFANFMADKSMKNADQTESYDLKFLIDHFPAAYSVDRTEGSNPIRQQLDNLKEAGTMYGNIIYHKAPIMMRQLERLMGEEPFKKGVREYLHRFSDGNASWPDLIDILDKYSEADLKTWNKVWVNETGRPVVDYSLQISRGKIGGMTVRQQPEYGKERLWPQFVELALYYKNGFKEVTVNLDSEVTKVPGVVGMDKPLFILFNSSAQGYGLWPLDEQMFEHVFNMEMPLHRATAYVSMYENMLNGRSIAPITLLELFLKGVEKEKEELNLKLICGYLNTIYWQFTGAEDRKHLSERLEKSLWQALEKQELSNNKKILLKAYEEIHMSSEASKRLYNIWSAQKGPEGVKLSEEDYTAMAFALALRDVPDQEILSQQLERIKNQDRKDRFRFIMPALSSEKTIRDSVFNSLKLQANREKESNVLSVLSYLHHPLRQATSISYLSESLDILEEIQVTGDIFFPQNWLQASFGRYQSREAANIVATFLRKHPDYNPKLKAKVLQNTDNLFRSLKLLNP